MTYRGERKHSKKREAILEVIRSTECHPSAQWVYDKLKPVIRDLSLATVYRNINLFIKEGLVVSCGVVGGEERFDGTTSPHPHTICVHCGKVADTPIPQGKTMEMIEDSWKIERPPEAGQNFSIDFRKTVFYGICQDCLNSAR
ncbi:MAG: transcriptional repressor [Treponema sp.]|jgi:Fur family peroxide stress response transcriptional regulator|nr:transcriptional repressor [Treponema sp.]